MRPIFRALFRPTLRAIATLACLLMLSGVPQVFAANKDIIQLQTQVQQLQSMLLTMQQSQDERMGVLTNVVQQTASSVAKISTQLDAVQKSMQNVQDADNGKLEQVSGQMQSLNDSVDELRARLDKLQKTLDGMQQQQQSLQAGQAPSGMTPGAPLTTTDGQPGQQDGQAQAQPPAPQAPPLNQLYQSALSDYNAAKYNLANQEFGDVIKYYPQDNLAGNAQFYQAEIAYRQGDYQTAIKGYSGMLAQFPGSSKAPAAQLRKAESLLSLGKKEDGIRELRALLQRYPQTPEAVQARSKLNGMGVRIYPKPEAGHSF